MNSPLFYHLYQYAQENLFRRSVDRDPQTSREYRQCRQYAEEALEQLRAALPPEALIHLERYLEAEELENTIDEEAMFHCGMTVGLGLFRLSAD